MRKIEKPVIKSGADIKTNTADKHWIPIIGFGIDFNGLCQTLNITLNNDDTSSDIWEVWHDFITQNPNDVSAVEASLSVMCGSNIDNTFIYVPAELPIRFDGELKPKHQFDFDEIISGIIGVIKKLMIMLDSDKDTYEVQDAINNYVYDTVGIIAVSDYC